MAASAWMPEKVHLVGSIGLDSVDEVFRTTGRLLGRRLQRVPDGEPGGRRLWISWQYPLLRASAFLRPDPAGGKRPTTGFYLLALAEGVTPEEISFGELGYAREARASYLDFLAARERGEIPAAARFQVCLPTPLAVVGAFAVPQAAAAMERAYEISMLDEVAAVCRAIPHRDLCLQWDVCTEMLIWDGRGSEMVTTAPVAREALLPRLTRLCAAVPEDVELGIHLCYGDFGGRHFADPVDAGPMVALANALAASVARPIAYIHLPVPLARGGEDTFFRPFADLGLAPGTEVYLGVVHAADGVAGVRQRVAAARKYLADFGIASECGMARARTPGTVTRLLQIHAEASREPAAGA